MTHDDSTTDERDLDLDRALRAHDVAPVDPAAARARLDLRLADLVGEAGDSEGPARPASPTIPITAAPSRRRRVTLARAAGLVAAASAGALAITLLPGPGDGNAYASWTATPAAVAERDAAVAVSQCRDAMRGPFWARQEGGSEEFDAQAATVALTERRGDLVSVLLRDEGPTKEFSGFCVVTLEQGASSGTVEGHGLGGAVGGPPAVAPDDGFLEGSMSQSGEDPISMVDGAVGAGVAGLTIHAGELSVEATLDGGRYAAWIPGRIFPDEEPQPSGRGGPEPILTYDLRLADGTLITDAEPARP